MVAAAAKPREGVASCGHILVSKVMNRRRKYRHEVMCLSRLWHKISSADICRKAQNDTTRLLQ